MIPALNKWLSTQGNDMITGLLFLVSAVAAIVALFGSPVLKAIIAAWFVFP